MASVLHVLATAGRRGAEMFAMSLAEGLEGRGWSNDCVAIRQGTGELGVPVVGLRTLRSRMQDVDVVLAHGSAALPACALADAGARESAPFVYRSIGDPSKWATTPARRLRVGLALQRSAGVVALWPEAAEYLRSRYRLRRPFVVSIPNAVDEARFTPVEPAERAEARRAYGVDGDGPVLAVLGALSPEKDVATALRAAALVEGARVLVAGSGAERASLEGLASSAGVDARFLGNVDDPGSVLAAADVLVLTSRTEGMPGAVMEAGARGVPVVATDVGGVRSVVDPPLGGAVVGEGDVEATAAAVREVLAEGRPVGARWLAGSYFMSSVADDWSSVLKRALGERPVP